jgi:hypothetical protein
VAGYAPDLNPTEQVAGSMKSKELPNLCADTIAEVADIAEYGLDRISSDASLCSLFSAAAVNPCDPAPGIFTILLRVSACDVCAAQFRCLT